MLDRFLADAVVVIHALFIVFTVLGGLLVLRWHWVAFLHIPAAAWGVIVQVIRDGVCPLTPLENYFRDRGGQAGYGESFIDHYLTNLIYVSDPPAWLHPALGIFVLVVNVTAYGLLVAQLVKRRRAKMANLAAAQNTSPELVETR
jgi:hypothetical protein